MIYFTLNPRNFSVLEKQENKERLQKILEDLHKAEEELIKTCEELGIDVPEIVAVQEKVNKNPHFNPSGNLDIQ